MFYRLKYVNCYVILIIYISIIRFSCPVNGQLGEITSEFRRCDEYTGYTDPDLGTVGHKCEAGALRLTLPPITCCAPQPPTATFPIFRLYLPGQDNPENGTILDWRDSHEASKIAPGEVVYLVHGWSETLWTSTWLRKVLDAWVMTRNKQVIVVDWHEGNKYYFQTIQNIITVGRVIGFSLVNWNLLDRADLVGQSAGAQVLGEAANFVKEKGSKPRYCVGLDPAGPFFDGGSTDIRLDKDDCMVVVGVHSSAGDNRFSGFLDRRPGTFERIGNCDYWINCGKTQGPHCMDGRLRDVLNDDGTSNQTTGMPDASNPWCAHHIAPLVYAAEVDQACPNEKGFQGIPCPDCGQADNCTASNGPTRRMIPDDCPKCGPNEESDWTVPTPVYLHYPYCNRRT